MRTRSLLAAATAAALVLAPGTAFAGPRPAAAKCQGKTATIVSSAAVITGTAKADVIVVKGAGAHRVRAGAGNDLVCGSPGNDAISGGDGNDALYGGPGSDSISGDAGNDTESGDAGNDILSGGAGADRISGGPGNDTEAGDAGNDVISGGDTADTLNGNAGDDTLNGNAGDDLLTGGPGNDTINGDAGSDDIDGNDGTDVVDGGDGANVLHLDDTDLNKRPEAADDKRGDDSEHVAVDQSLVDALVAAGTYLGAGIKAGDITGNGSQTLLPDAPSVGAAPVSDLVKDVTWNVSTKDGQPRVFGCVDGTVDGTNFYKFRLEPRDGKRDVEGVKYSTGREDLRRDSKGGKPDKPRPVTTGKCETNFVPVVAPADLAKVLTDAGTYIANSIAAGTLVGRGTQATLPEDGKTPAPQSSSITAVTWNVRPSGLVPFPRPASMEVKAPEGRFCITGTADGTTFYRYGGEVSEDGARGRVLAGACKMPSAEAKSVAAADAAVIGDAINALLATVTDFGDAPKRPHDWAELDDRTLTLGFAENAAGVPDPASSDLQVDNDTEIVTSGHAAGATGKAVWCAAVKNRDMVVIVTQEGVQASASRCSLNGIAS